MKQPIGPVLPGTRQVLLAFGEGSIRPRDVGGRSADVYSEQVQRPFLPKGLIIWGATGDTLVHGVRVGNMSELDVGGCSPVPGLYFAQGRSFEEIVRLAEAGELVLSTAARQQLEMHEALPGTLVVVSISGPYDRLCMWGTTYVQGGPHRRAVVEALGEGRGFLARLDEVTLGGVRTVLDVTAPDAQTAAQLLAGLELPARSRW